MDITAMEVQALRELLNRIPWVSTAEALFLHAIVAKLEAELPPPEPGTDIPGWSAPVSNVKSELPSETEAPLAQPEKVKQEDQPCAIE